MAQHGGCDVLKGTKWVANLWLTLVGESGTEEAFKGWIDYGKDESKFQPGTNWKGEAVKTDATGDSQGSKEKEKSKEEGSESEKKEESTKDKKKTIEEAKKESGDGSYDVKLEL